MKKSKYMYTLFFKSKGGDSTTGQDTEYHAEVATIEANNFVELGTQADKIISNLGQNVDDFAIDVLNRGSEYENANGTGKEIMKNYNSNSTLK